MSEIIARAAIAEAAVERFGNKPFEWGERDCATLAKFALMRAGHPNPLKGAKDYRGRIGAVRALAHALKVAKLPKDATMVDVLDAMGLERIAAAAALPGDLVGLHGEAPFGVALAIAVGNNKALGFAPDPEAETVDGLQPERAVVGEMLVEVGGVVAAFTAWRVPCL